MPFPAWETFYVVLGSASGALTGLMFVVSALFVNVPDAPEDTMHAYATPTVVHLGNVLLLSLIVVAPWRGPMLDVAIGLFGLCGSVYMLVVWRRAARQTGYTPVAADWVWYTALPFAGYFSTLVGAVILRRRTTAALFLIGGAAVLLLFIGIHNSWDNVVYLTIGRRGQRREAGE